MSKFYTLGNLEGFDVNYQNAIKYLSEKFPKYNLVLTTDLINPTGIKGEKRKVGFSTLWIDDDCRKDKYISDFVDLYCVVLSNAKNKSTISNAIGVYVSKSQSKIDYFVRCNFKDNSNQPESATLIKAPVTPYFSLDKVILNKKLRAEIDSSIELIRNHRKIYDEWGFSEIDSKPRLILNFYGPPGTGKTMTAHAIARELGKSIMLVNYSEIESKYVGDAPKNLTKAFEVAKENNSVLFFDEADSFLGKRIENVSHSSDQAVNSLRSQMLIHLENFEGVVLFATNLVKNYDPAFESRILKHLEFTLPDLESRIHIIRSMFPDKAPVHSDVFEVNKISILGNDSEGFSGRNIKNAMLESFVDAVQSKQEFITFENMKAGFSSVKTKLEGLANAKGNSRLSDEFKKKIVEKIKSNQIKENVS